MTDELDTKPLPTIAPKDAPPDVAEGEDMPPTLEVLDMKLRVIEVEIKALKEWRTTLLTREQIVEIVKETNAASVQRVEELVDTAMKRFGEIEFSAAKVDALGRTLQELVLASNERGKSHEFTNRALSSLLGYDINQPNAPRIGLSIFEIINQTNETADSAAKSVDAVRDEIAQVRIDSVKILTAANQIEAYHAEHKAAFAAIAQNAQRWKSVQEAVKTIASNPKLLIPTVAAFGSGLVVAPEAIKALGTLIVSIFTGAN